MPREIKIQFNLRIAPFSLKGGLAGLLLAACATELGSESVTLSTYYPAPSGVYTQMITTSNTYLARDGGRVGVGTPAPLSKLDLKGGMALGAYAGTAAAPPNGLIVSGSVGVGTGSPAQALHVRGNARVSGSPGVSGYLHVDNSGSDCAPTTVGTGNVPVCSSGQYATWTPGLYVEGFSFNNRGGQPMADYGSGTTTQVWGLNTATGQASWMTLRADNFTLGAIYCCPK